MLRRAVELGVDHIDTGQCCGPDVALLGPGGPAGTSTRRENTPIPW